MNSPPPTSPPTIDLPTQVGWFETIQRLQPTSIICILPRHFRNDIVCALKMKPYHQPLFHWARCHHAPIPSIRRQNHSYPAGSNRFRRSNDRRSGGIGYLRLYPCIIPSLAVVLHIAAKIAIGGCCMAIPGGNNTQDYLQITQQSNGSRG